MCFTCDILGLDSQITITKAVFSFVFPFEGEHHFTAFTNIKWQGTQMHEMQEYQTWSWSVTALQRFVFLLLHQIQSILALAINWRVLVFVCGFLVVFAQHALFHLRMTYRHWGSFIKPDTNGFMKDLFVNPSSEPLQKNFSIHESHVIVGGKNCTLLM